MDGDEKKKLKILQISNISVAATKDQVFSMCQYLGRIDDVKVSFRFILLLERHVLTVIKRVN